MGQITHCAHDSAFDLASRADSVRNLRFFFKPDPFPGLSGPAAAPKGQNSADRSGAGFLFFCSLRSAQYTWGPPPLGVVHPRVSAGWRPRPCRRSSSAAPAPAARASRGARRCSPRDVWRPVLGHILPIFVGGPGVDRASSIFGDLVGRGRPEPSN